MDLAAMTGAGGTIELGGRTLLLRRLTFRDRAQLREWVKAKTPRPMAVVAEGLKDLEPLKQADPEAYRLVCEKLTLQDQQRGTLNEEAALNLLDSTEGTAFYLWLRLRAEQPELTVEAVKAMLEAEEPEALAKKLKALAERETPPPAEDKPVDPPGPAPEAPRAATRRNGARSSRT
jgi:hypothetical protein